MRGNNVVGVLFSNVHDDKIRELTERRTIASVPFGGRYRLIDFPLSNMVNSGISKVGVVTKSNFQSSSDSSSCLFPGFSNGSSPCVWSLILLMAVPLTGHHQNNKYTGIFILSELLHSQPRYHLHLTDIRQFHNFFSWLLWFH